MSFTFGILPLFASADLAISPKTSANSSATPFAPTATSQATRPVAFIRIIFLPKSIDDCSIRKTSVYDCLCFVYGWCILADFQVLNHFLNLLHKITILPKMAEWLFSLYYRIYN